MKPIYIYVGENRDGVLMNHWDNGQTWAHRRIYIGGTKLKDMIEDQVTAAIQLTLRHMVIPVGAEVVLFDGPRWVKTHRKYTLLRWKNTSCLDNLRTWFIEEDKL